MTSRSVADRVARQTRSVSENLKYVQHKYVEIQIESVFINDTEYQGRHIGSAL